MGCNYIEDIIEGFKEIDVVLVLNNHYKNNKFNLMDTLVYTNKPCMFFDGWDLFNQTEIEKFVLLQLKMVIYHVSNTHIEMVSHGIQILVLSRLEKVIYHVLNMLIEMDVRGIMILVL